MRRVLAILLTGLFSFSLMAPLLLSQEPDARLPECCRRAGKHHCSMGQSSSTQDSGARLNATCPLYSNAGVTQATGSAPSLKPLVASFAAVPAHQATHAQTAARYRLSHSRSSQKRGPPQLLS